MVRHRQSDGGGRSDGSGRSDGRNRSLTTDAAGFARRVMSASPQRRTWWQGGADWNMEQWGRDELALERHAHRFAELKAAAMVLQNLLPA
jgi:hypothetical protein